MKNYSFCTYCDINYLPRALTLYDSLAKHCEIPFNLYILCLDEESYSNLITPESDCTPLLHAFIMRNLKSPL